MQGQDVVTVDGHKLGRVVAERDEIAVVEHGLLRKTRHAIPEELLHEADGTLRATVAKQIVDSSPAVDGDRFDREAVLEHYGLIGPTVVDPDPDGLDSAETMGAREGVTPAPVERLATLAGESDPSFERPAVFDKRPGGADDPSGTTANYH